ncbi:spore coat protein GerQ [Oceanobacillus halotolerans]|uniref:spore coat protein GerQ n=1 Tax=Oceanobacillus halotolerans TaxID=2663380 RepID=UPI0013DCD877|nr:spore coat protein GerQ [Oceanobacillus halotolerans]
MSEKRNNNTNGTYTNPYPQYPYFYYPQASPAYYPATNMGQQQVPQMPVQQQSQQQQQQPTAGANQGMLPIEQSYIENILRLNKGKIATVYMTFENNDQWNAKVFKGVIEAAGRDHIILSDPQTQRRYVLLMVYLDYITFDEEIEYSYPYSGVATTPQQMSTYPPR